MKKKPARAGFIGAVFIVNLHIEGLHRVYDPNTEFVNVHSRNRDKAAAFADTYRGSVLNDLDDLLE